MAEEETFMFKLFEAFGQKIEFIGRKGLFIALAIVYIWIGAMKFTAYEANEIAALVSNSPVLGWLYNYFSIRTFSSLLGVLELLVGLLILSRFVSAKLSAVGAFLSCILFLTTLSFMVSTPGVFEPSLGFPALSAAPGQFLLKDLVLLGASVFALGESLKAASRGTFHETQQGRYPDVGK
jgi:reactive chlorine resistance protein C